jgi:hypothetical protein
MNLLNAAVAVSHQPAAGGGRDIVLMVDGVLMLKIQEHNFYHLVQRSAGSCGRK